MNTVELIHNEIDTAEDRLLNKALEQIEQVNKLTLEISKAERLKNLGFVNSESVIETTKELDKLNLAKTESNTILYYKETYPFLKFITVEELDRICDKYKLVYAPVINYTKDVPEKNLRDIENAQKLKYEDCAKSTYRYKFNYYSYVPKTVRRFMNKLETQRLMEADSEFRSLCPIKYSGDHLYKTRGITSYRTDKSGLFIAAPKSHFNLNGLTKSRFGFFNTVLEPKDPIVFRYVQGGVQIITKWGLEAEDPSLINPITN